MPLLPWPDLSDLRMAVVPVRGPNGNALVLEDGLGLPELAEALGFRPWKGLHVVHRGVTDPDFEAATATVSAAVAYLLPEIPFKAMDPVALAAPDLAGIPGSARAVREALASAPVADAPVPAQADPAATRRFETMASTTPGSILADACAFAKPDPFAKAALSGDAGGPFAFVLSDALAMVGRHHGHGAQARVVALDGPGSMRLGITKSVSGRAVTFVVEREGKPSNFVSRALATAHLRDVIRQAVEDASS